MPLTVGTNLLISLGEAFVSADLEQVLLARPLGSTAALAVHDPASLIGGLVHWMLPDSRLVPGREGRSPCLFADQGIPLLLDALRKEGAGRKGLKCALAGAASLPEGGEYDVGRRNREIAQRLLKKYGLDLVLEATGGPWVRELSLEVGAGSFAVHRTHE
jgi:chemotaxis protein CheD